MIDIFELSQDLLTKNRIISLKLSFSSGALIECVRFVTEIPSQYIFFHKINYLLGR